MCLICYYQWCSPSQSRNKQESNPHQCWYFQTTQPESQTLRWKNATFILIRKICSKCWSSSLSNKNWCPQILYLPAARLGNIQNLRTIIFVVNNFPKQDFDSCSIKCLLFHRCPSIIKFRCQLNLCLGPTFLPDQAKIAKLLIDWAIRLGFSRLLSRSLVCSQNGHVGRA